MNKHFSWSSSGELWGLSEKEGIVSFLLFPDMTASVWGGAVQNQRAPDLSSAPKTRFGGWRSTNFKFHLSQFDTKTDVMLDSTEGWTLSGQRWFSSLNPDFQGFQQLLFHTRPAKVPLKSKNSECCLCFGTVAEGLLRPGLKPKRVGLTVKPTLHIWTHWALCFILGSMMIAFLQKGMGQTYLPRSVPLECMLLLCPSVR